MKVNSVNNNTHAPCQNRPQNFGALLFTQQGEKAMLKFTEKGLPGSLGDFIGKAVLRGVFDVETGEQLLGLQGSDVLVLNRPKEINLLNDALTPKEGAETTGIEMTVATTIQNLLDRAHRFDVRKIVGLKPGQTLRDLILAKKSANAPIPPSIPESILFDINSDAHPVEPLILNSAYLDIDAKVEQMRAELFKLAEQGAVDADFESAIPTSLTHGRHPQTSLPTKSGEFDFAPATINAQTPFIEA